MGRPVLLLVVLLAPFVVACVADATSAPLPSPTPTTSSPPLIVDPHPATLVYGTALAAGAAGTRCWSGVCIDLVGPVTPAVPLVAGTGHPFALSFAAGDPDEFGLSWYLAPVPMPPVSNGERSWSIDPRSATPATALQVPAEPGLYILSVFARWDGLGDVTYSWLIDVR